MKVSRRQFIKYCIASAAALGLDASVVSQLTKALAADGSGAWPTVVWVNGANCTGCTVSLANRIGTAEPTDVADLFINHINLAFHPNLMGASGDMAVASLERATLGSFILAVDGGIPTAFDGHACMVWTKAGQEVTALSAVRDLASRSIANLSIGTCASYGGVPAAKPNPTGIQSLSGATGRSTINIPGCPAHPDWIVWVIAQLLAGIVPALDSTGRPTALYGSRVHSNCPRRESDEVSSLGQNNSGCLREVGCHGPESSADCPSRRWNNATNWCIGANSLCLACTQSGFPDTFSPFYTNDNWNGNSPVDNGGVTPVALGISLCEYRSIENDLRVYGQGVAGASVIIRSNTGATLGTVTVNAQNQWQLNIQNPATVPTSVTAESQGQTVTANVVGLPTTQPLSITLCEYRSVERELRVYGVGNKGATVVIRSNTGTTLGTVTIDAQNQWQLNIQNPAVVPQSVTAEGQGQVVTAIVAGAPVARDLAITLCEYRSSERDLRVFGTGTAGAAVTIKSNTGTTLGVVTVNLQNQWQLALQNPTTVPTSVSAQSLGVTVTLVVSGAPTGGNQNVNFQFSSAVYRESNSRLELRGLGQTAATVTFTNVSTGRSLGSAKVREDLTWQINIEKPRTVPRRVRATMLGKSLERDVQIIRRSQSSD